MKPKQEKYKVSTKYEPAFISKGFTNWNMLQCMVFNKHLKNDCHKNAAEIHELPKNTGDVG